MSAPTKLEARAQSPRVIYPIARQLGSPTNLVQLHTPQWVSLVAGGIAGGVEAAITVGLFICI